MKDNKEIMCDQCKKSVPMSQAKYAPYGKDSVTVLCQECRDRTNVIKKKKIIFEKEEHEIPKIKLIGDAKKPIKFSKKAEYFCFRCNYKFKFDKSGEGNLRCPYCAESDAVTDCSTLSAENLLREVKDLN